MNINYLIENIVNKTIEKYLIECKRNETPLQKKSNEFLNEIFNHFQKELDVQVKKFQDSNTIYFSWLGKNRSNNEKLIYQLRISDHIGDVIMKNNKNGFIYNQFSFISIAENSLSKVRQEYADFMYVFDIRLNKNFDLLRSDFAKGVLRPLKSCIYCIYNFLDSLFYDPDIEHYLNFDKISENMKAIYDTELNNKNKDNEYYKNDLLSKTDIDKLDNDINELINKRNEFYNTFFNNKINFKCLKLFYFICCKFRPNEEETPKTESTLFSDFCIKYFNLYITPDLAIQLINKKNQSQNGKDPFEYLNRLIYTNSKTIMEGHANSTINNLNIKFYRENFKDPWFVSNVNTDTKELNVIERIGKLFKKQPIKVEGFDDNGNIINNNEQEIINSDPIEGVDDNGNIINNNEQEIFNLDQFEGFDDNGDMLQNNGSNSINQKTSDNGSTNGNNTYNSSDSKDKNLFLTDTERKLENKPKVLGHIQIPNKNMNKKPEGDFQVKLKDFLKNKDNK